MSGIRRRAIQKRIVEERNRAVGRAEMTSGLLAVSQDLVTKALAERDALQDELTLTQKELDALVFEYCPEKATTEQFDRWVANQRLAVVGSVHGAVLPEVLDLPEAEIEEQPT